MRKWLSAYCLVVGEWCCGAVLHACSYWIRTLNMDMVIYVHEVVRSHDRMMFLGIYDGIAYKLRYISNIIIIIHITLRIYSYLQAIALRRNV